MIHIFASAPLPPLSFSFSPPSSSPPCSSSAGLLLLSAAETGCVTSLKAGAVPWLEQEGEKNGEKIRRWVRPHVSFSFSNIPLSSDHVCVSVCVCMLCRFTAAAPLFPCNEFYATSGVRVQQGASAAVKTQEKIGYTPGCPLPVVHGCCHEHRCELSWTPGLGLCVYVCALAGAFVAVR